MSRAYIEWRPDYEIGVEDIDLQHRYFVVLLNRFMDEISSTDTQYREALIAELNAYARFHFISEENTMKRANYPMLREHKNSHRELMDQLSSKQHRVLMENTELANNALIDFLVAWFLQHTKMEDQLFAEFLHEQTSAKT